MTVLELMAKLNTMPKDAVVHVNDNNNGNYFEELDVVFFEESNEVVVQVNFG